MCGMSSILDKIRGEKSGIHVNGSSSQLELDTALTILTAVYQNYLP